MAYSRLRERYKIWDIQSSRNVTFNETCYTSTEIPISNYSPEKSKKVDDNIDFNEVDPTQETADPADVINEVTKSTDEEEPNETFQDAQDTLPHQRSNLERKQTGEWWRATSLLSQAVPSHDVPKSCKAGTTPEDSGFWNQGWTGNTNA